LPVERRASRSRATIAEYGGLELDQAKRMKDLERENVRLKRLVADLSLEKQVLKDVASGNL
jgi:putative transposase